MNNNKRVFSINDQDDVVGSWEGLNPEILALIFVRIPADQMVRAVSLVCKGWLVAVAGPYCWTDIDMEQWCRGCKHPDLIDPAVCKLVRRSKCTFKRLSAFRLGNAGFSFVANCGRCLKVLQIPLSQITDQMVEKHAESLSNLTVLDISYCLKITYKGLEAFGKQCKSLVHFKRNMPPPAWGIPANLFDFNNDDREAMIIADTMTELRVLELGFGRFGDHGLNAILTKCKSLTHLDIQGCLCVELEDGLEERCERLAVFKSPWVDVDVFDNERPSGSDSIGADVDEKNSSSASD